MTGTACPRIITPVLNAVTQLAKEKKMQHWFVRIYGAVDSDRLAMFMQSAVRGG